MMIPIISCATLNYQNFIFIIWKYVSTDSLNKTKYEKFIPGKTQRQNKIAQKSFSNISLSELSSPMSLATKQSFGKNSESKYRKIFYVLSIWPSP